MISDLQGQLICAMARLKRLEAVFQLGCGMQMNELAILKSIAGGCACEASAGMNLDVGSLQERLGISKPGISYILGALEKKRYITREIDPSDRRKIAIRITDIGREAVEQALRRCDEAWQAFLERYGEADMRQLIGLLEKLDDVVEDK